MSIEQSHHLQQNLHHAVDTVSVPNRVCSTSSDKKGSYERRRDIQSVIVTQSQMTICKGAGAECRSVETLITTECTCLAGAGLWSSLKPRCCLNLEQHRLAPRDAPVCYVGGQCDQKQIFKVHVSRFCRVDCGLLNLKKKKQQHSSVSQTVWQTEDSTKRWSLRRWMLMNASTALEVAVNYEYRSKTDGTMSWSSSSPQLEDIAAVDVDVCCGKNTVDCDFYTN